MKLHTLTELRLKAGLAEKEYCSPNENAELLRMLEEGGTLPEGVYCDTDGVGAETCELYRITERDVGANRSEYLMLMLLRAANGILAIGITIAVLLSAVLLVLMFG